jgi:hypothetical protein
MRQDAMEFDAADESRDEESLGRFAASPSTRLAIFRLDPMMETLGRRVLPRPPPDFYAPPPSPPPRTPSSRTPSRPSSRPSSASKYLNSALPILSRAHREASVVRRCRFPLPEPPTAPPAAPRAPEEPPAPWSRGWLHKGFQPTLPRPALRPTSKLFVDSQRRRQAADVFDERHRGRVDNANATLQRLARHVVLDELRAGAAFDIELREVRWSRYRVDEAPRTVGAHKPKGSRRKQFILFNSIWAPRAKSSGSKVRPRCPPRNNPQL